MSRARRRSVTAGRDPKRLREIAELSAIHEGRVFVDGARACDPEAVPPPGATIDVYAARQADEPVRILAEHGGLIFAYKPAAIATEPDRQGARQSLIHEVARLVGVQPAALHAGSRLDVGVSGVVLIVRKTEGPSRVQSSRRYVAIAERAPEPEVGTWTGAIDGRQAETRYRVAAVCSSRQAVLQLEPVTGRKHQLRVHAARAGAPLLGDRAYGGRPRITIADGSVLDVAGIALHAIAVEVGDFRVVAPVPTRLTDVWVLLGGDPRAFEQW